MLDIATKQQIAIYFNGKEEDKVYRVHVYIVHKIRGCQNKNPKLQDEGNRRTKTEIRFLLFTATKLLCRNIF